MLYDLTRALCRGVTLLAALLLAAACTSTPEATPRRDAAAKEFLTHPNAATVYVYRSPFNHYDYDTVLYLDGRVIGSTLPGAYFRIDVNPGRHILHGTGVDVGQLEFEMRPGKLYFVQLEVNAGHSQFRLVPEHYGKQQVVACCALLENWAPGQRPFLR